MLCRSSSSLPIRTENVQTRVFNRQLLPTMRSADMGATRGMRYAIKSTVTAPFDVVIIGAGMCGAYCAEKLYRHDELYRPEKDKRRLRFLVIEEGPFLFPTHVQNLPKVPASRGTYDLVWRTPWTGNEAFIGTKKDDFRGQAFCVGGRSLFWAGWAPRLTRGDLAKWPKPARDLLLNGGYARTEREVGADRNTD